LLQSRCQSTLQELEQLRSEGMALLEALSRQGLLLSSRLRHLHQTRRLDRRWTAADLQPGESEGNPDLLLNGGSGGSGAAASSESLSENLKPELASFSGMTNSVLHHMTAYL